MDYVDFDLEIGTGADGEYSVKARALGAVAKGTFRFPFDPSGGDALKTRLQALQIALLRSGSTPRRSATQESTAVEDFGVELWDAMFVGDVRARYAATRAAAGPGRGVRTRLSFADPALGALPWEFVFDRARDDFMALSPGTPIVRFIEMDEVIEPLEVAPPIRILGMAASPNDLPKLQIDRERELLTDALEPLRRRGVIELVWVPGRTRQDLNDALLQGPWHVFHFIGHGGYEEIQHEGSIFVENDAGLARRLSAKDLGLLLGARRSLQLAILNSCEGAKGDEVDVFSSTAATLVRKGTPAVIAMQFEITDDAAIEFSRSLYYAIGLGLPVDTALAEARLSVATEFSGTLEWGTPVLFMRSSDGVLFRIPKQSPEELDKLERDIEEARRAAEVAIAAKAAEEAAVAKAAEEAAAAKAIADEAAAEKLAADNAAANYAAAVAAKAAADKAATDRAATDRAAADQAAADKAAADKLAAEAARRKARDRLLKRVALVLAAAIGVVVLAFVFLPRPDQPRLAASVSQARAGELVSLSGSGFAPRLAITLWVGEARLASVVTNDDGAFVTSITIPAIAAGTNSILAKDASGNATPYAFEILGFGDPSAAPSSAPAPVSLTIPSVVGLSTAEAQLALAGACEPTPCFEMGVETQAQDGADVGIVHSQAPEAGAGGSAGDVVTVFVIPDPPTPQPPDPLSVKAVKKYDVEPGSWTVRLTLTPDGGSPPYRFEMDGETKTSDDAAAFEIVAKGCVGVTAQGSVSSDDGQTKQFEFGGLQPPECKAGPPSAPVALKPDGASDLGAFSCGSHTVTLIWAEVDDAAGGARYALMLESSTDGQNWTEIEVGLATGSETKVSLHQCSRYRWSVTAIDAFGRRSETSNQHSFKTVHRDLFTPGPVFPSGSPPVIG